MKDHTTFADIALPMAALNIPVVPVQPNDKACILPQWQQLATCDIETIDEWNNENSAYNVGLVAKAQLGAVCFLEFDINRGMKLAAEEMGQPIPQTRVHRSGKGFYHWLFTHTGRSLKVGNRSANLPEGGEWFSFRADNRYVVGPGSTHPNGNKYEVAKDVEIAPMPDWLCDFIEKHTIPAQKPKDTVPVHEDFDFDDFCDFYGIGIAGVKDGVWHIPDVCPGVGHRHEGSKLTAFFFDGGTLGWHCFAQQCPLSEKSVGEVVKFLNDQKGEPYRGVIWESEGIDFDDPKFAIEEADLDVADQLIESASSRVSGTSVVITSPSPHEPQWQESECGNGSAVVSAEGSSDLYAALVEHALDANPLPLPTPKEIAIVDPDKHDGLEFPGECCMYGRLAEIAAKYPRLQLGWLYPSLLAVASALDIEDADHNVRANMYVANLGDVGFGKTACQEAARRSIFLPEMTVMEETPSSDRGLAHMLGGEETVSRLLFSDEFRAIMQKCAIQGSALPQMICQLWSKDKAGVADKKGVQPCFAKLSIIGNVACKDPSDFAKLFGSNTVTGMADRFLFGLSSQYVKFRPYEVKAEIFDNLKPVRIPEWVWDAKDMWGGEEPDRRRLTEHALRVALVTAACNGDREFTAPCLEASLRFMEWQQRIREIYRPGLAETKEAEAYESVYAALWERLNKQINEGISPKGADAITKDKQEQCRLLHFAQVVNSKSYYRKYAGLIDRARKSMVDNGIIEEVREYETDDRGNETKGKKTPFVRLRGRIR